MSEQEIGRDPRKRKEGKDKKIVGFIPQGPYRHPFSIVTKKKTQEST